MDVQGSATAVKAIDADFDPHDPAFAHCAYAVLDCSREAHRVSRSEKYGGFWIVTGYDDVCDVAHSPKTFSNRNGVAFPALMDSESMIPIVLDPPDNIPYRRVLAPVFAPAAVEKRQGAIRDIVNYLIDEFIQDGSVDFYQQLGTPLAAIVTLRLLGMDATQWPRYAEASHTVWEHGWLPNLPQEQLDSLMPRVMENYAWVFSTMSDRINEAAKNPDAGDSVIDHLVRAEIDGQPIPHDRMTHIVHNVYEAGLDTTATGLACMAVRLSDDTQLRSALAANPHKIPAFIEESLRIESPVTLFSRVATCDHRIGEHEIKAGDTVLISWAAANRDPRAFTDPTTFKLDRKPNRHLAFGLGAHRCLGSHIARAELRIVLEELLRRIPDFSVDRDGLVLSRDAGIVFGYFAVPASFAPGRRENRASADVLKAPW